MKGRWDKGVPCLSLGSLGWNIWGSSAPLPPRSLQKLCVYVSLIYPGQCFSCDFGPELFFSSLSPCLHPFSLALCRYILGEFEMGNIKMDEISALKVTAYGETFGKEEMSIIALSRDLGSTTGMEVHVDDRFWRQMCRVCSAPGLKCHICIKVKFHIVISLLSFLFSSLDF